MQLTLTLATLVSLASAHGSIDTITVNGQTWKGASPYNTDASPMWRVQNGDNGFVADPTSGDIACHKSAQSPSQVVPVKAGDTLSLHWSNGFNHPGAVLNYLAPTQSTASALRFFKISHEGVRATTPTWGSDVMVSQSNVAKVQIPTNLKAGPYTLRHEIIALHSAGQKGGAQFYPFCINLQVSGDGDAQPDGVAATSLYKATDPGVLINIYNPYVQPGMSYSVPGPAVASGLQTGQAVKFRA